MKDDIECEYGRFVINRGPTKQEGRLLNEYLIPYLSREDIEEEAENILRLKWPETRQNTSCLNPGYITQTLGLRAVNLPLYRREKMQSILGGRDHRGYKRQAKDRPRQRQHHRHQHKTPELPQFKQKDAKLCVHHPFARILHLCEMLILSILLSNRHSLEHRTVNVGMGMDGLRSVGIHHQA